MWTHHQHLQGSIADRRLPYDHCLGNAKQAIKYILLWNVEQDFPPMFILKIRFVPLGWCGASQQTGRERIVSDKLFSFRNRWNGYILTMQRHLFYHKRETSLSSFEAIVRRMAYTKRPFSASRRSIRLTNTQRKVTVREYVCIYIYIWNPCFEDSKAVFT